MKFQIPYSKIQIPYSKIHILIVVGLLFGIVFIQQGLSQGRQLIFQEARQWQVVADSPDPDTRTIEQQINIIDREFSVGGPSGCNSSDDACPSDNALGYILWDGNKYNGETVYFEAVIYVSDASYTANAGLYTDGGTLVTGSTVSTSTTSYVRVRTASSISLTDGTNYTVRIWRSVVAAGAFIKAARLIIVQSTTTGYITDTETQIEVGDNSSTTATTYTDLNDKKIYLYDETKFNPVPATTTFEATIKTTPVPTNEVFTAAGTTTNWQVPSGITSLTIRVWGAGGGSGAGGDKDVGGTGGGGGFVKDTLTVNPGDYLNIVVGGDGKGGANGTNAAYDGAGGGGGGHSAVLSGTTYLVMAGGGGGGGSGSEPGDDGGDGGGGGTHTIKGVAGGRGTSGTSGGCGGDGASSTAPGAGGACLAASPDGSPGVGMTGGAGANAGTAPYDCAGGAGGTPGNGGAGGSGDGEDLPGGGGGGGGRYGGGGGEAGNTTNDIAAGGGGGGSGLCSDGACDSEAAGSNTSPGNTTDRNTYCLSTSGNGGAESAADTAGNNGASGCVVITYTSPTTAYAILYNITANATVTASEISVATTTWTRVRTASSFSLTSGNEYSVQIKSSNASATASIANAKIILDQTDPTNGIDAVEMVHQYVNTKREVTETSWARTYFDNEYNPDNWDGGDFDYYFEATMKGAEIYADLATNTTQIINSEISTSSASYVRKRSASELVMPTSVITTDTRTHTFTCGGDVSYGGQSYSTIAIGSQCWFAENLNVGTMIIGANEQNDDLTLEKYCYNDDSGICTTDGGLYQWAEAMDLPYDCNATDTCSIDPTHQGICPSGWHIPTDGEWTTLTDYLSANSEYWCGGVSTSTAKSLASTDAVEPNWTNSITACEVGNDRGSNNLTGFTVLPTGNRTEAGSFVNRTVRTYLWGASQYVIATSAWTRSLHYNYTIVDRYWFVKTGGKTVRCLRD